MSLPKRTKKRDLGNDSQTEINIWGDSKTDYKMINKTRKHYFQGA